MHPTVTYQAIGVLTKIILAVCVSLEALAADS